LFVERDYVDEREPSLTTATPSQFSTGTPQDHHQKTFLVVAFLLILGVLSSTRFASFFYFLFSSLLFLARKASHLCRHKSCLPIIANADTYSLISPYWFFGNIFLKAVVGIDSDTHLDLKILSLKTGLFYTGRIISLNQYACKDAIFDIADPIAVADELSKTSIRFSLTTTINDYCGRRSPINLRETLEESLVSLFNHQHSRDRYHRVKWKCGCLDGVGWDLAAEKDRKNQHQSPSFVLWLEGSGNVITKNTKEELW